MLKELLVKLQKLSRERVHFNPSRFDDQIAVKTEWTPAKGGGANSLRDANAITKIN